MCDGAPSVCAQATPTVKPAPRTDQQERRVCNLKDALDDRLPDEGVVDRQIIRYMYRHQLLDPQWNLREPGKRVIVSGEPFAQAVLPFSAPSSFRAKQAVVRSVDPFRVLAGAYRRVSKLTVQAQQDLADSLDDHSRKNGNSVALYVRLGPFNLYVATEGKNRVSIYRNLNRPIVAQVFNSPYPQPQDLRLVRLTPFGGTALRWCGGERSSRLYARPWQRIARAADPMALLPFSESVELLQAYGVPWSKTSEIAPLAPLHARMLRAFVARCYYVR